MKCQKCKTENPEHAKFCFNCGRLLVTREAITGQQISTPNLKENISAPRIRTLNLVIQIIRDSIIVLFSILYIKAFFETFIESRENIIIFGHRFNPYGTYLTLSDYLMLGIVCILIILTMINVIILFIRTKGKGYFYFNTIIQLILSLNLSLLDFFIGGILFLLNLAILLTLK